MHKLRHGGFNARKDKKEAIVAPQYSRDKVGRQVVIPLSNHYSDHTEKEEMTFITTKKSLLQYFMGLPDRGNGFINHQRAGLHVHSIYPLS